MDATQLAEENKLELWPTVAKTVCTRPFNNVNKTVVISHIEAKSLPNQSNAIPTGASEVSCRNL